MVQTEFASILLPFEEASVSRDATAYGASIALIAFKDFSLDDSEAIGGVAPWEGDAPVSLVPGDCFQGTLHQELSASPGAQSGEPTALRSESSSP